jgi:hypothetical protein
LGQPDLHSDDGICRTCPWNLVVAVLAGKAVPMSRKKYVDTVVAALRGERAPEIITALVKNFCVEPHLAKLALRRAIRSYKMRKVNEKR